MTWRVGDTVRTLGDLVAARAVLKRIIKAQRKTKMTKYREFLAEDYEQVLAEIQDYRKRKKTAREARKWQKNSSKQQSSQSKPQSP